MIGICSESDDRLCIVTSYCENGSLYSYVRSHSLSKDEVMKLLRGVAAGMYHLVQEGFVHRDLAGVIWFVTWY